MGNSNDFTLHEPLVGSWDCWRYSLWRGSLLADLALTSEVNPITQRC